MNRQASYCLGGLMPATIEAPKVQTTSAEPVVLTDELLRDLDEHPEKIHDLDRKTRNAVLDRMKSQADEGADGTDTGAKTDTEKKAIPAETDKATTEEPKKTETEDVTELQKQREAKKEEAQRLAEEINRYEQRIKARKEREERLKKEWEEFEKAGVKKPADVFDETHQNTVAHELALTKKKLELMESRYQARENEEILEAETHKKKLEEDRVFGEFENLQGQYEELRTKEPLRVLNQKYANWLDSLVAESGVKTSNPDADPATLRQKAVERYNTDSEFQKKVSAKPPEEMDKLALLLQLNERKAKVGGTVRGHWLEMLDEQGIIADVVQKGKKAAATEATNKTISALKKGADEISTISPSDGTAKAGYTDSGMNESAAKAFLHYVTQKHLAGGVLTPEEKSKFKLVREFLAGAT